MTQTSARGVSPLNANAGTIAVLLAFAGALLLFLASPRFLDPVVDTGRDLYLTERLLQGETLYRDYRYNYPPLAPLLLAAFASVVGTGLGSFAMFGALMAFATALLTERIVRTFSSAAVSICAELTVVVAHFFVRSGFNFAFPYSYSAVLGLVILLSLVLVLLRSTEKPPRLGTCILATVLAVAAALTKVEFGAAAFVALLGLVRRGNPMTYIWLFLAPGVSFASLLFVDFHWNAGLPVEETLLGAFTGPLSRGVAASFYTAALKGTDRPAELMIKLLAATAVPLAILAIARLMRTRGRNFPPSNLSTGGALIVLTVAALWSVSFFYLSIVVFLPWLLWRAFRDHDVRLTILLAGTIAPLLRIGINFGPQWLGFSLCVPILLATLYLWLEVLPRTGAITATVSRWMPLILLGISTAAGFERLPYILSRNHPVATSRGTFYIEHDRFSQELQSFVSDTLTEKPEKVLVIPEGVMLNYLTRTKTPCRYYSFLPLETGSPEVESRLLECLMRNPPEKIVEVPRSIGLFRSGEFGVDYNVPVRRWIEENYIREIGHGPIAQMRRR